MAFPVDDKKYYDSFPAQRHATPALAADAATAVAAGVLYKCVVFLAAGNLAIVDAYGNSEVIAGVAGMVYPVQNYGAISTGSDLDEGQFACLYD